jgi:Na+-transporting methylmalonyl-CoA/oxaloacetate decarboxylase gamma subunit
MTSQAVAAVSFLAAEDVNNFGDTRGGALAGPLGLFMILVLLIATVLLIRNMNARLRRLPREFPPAAEHAEKSERAEKSDGRPEAAPISPAPEGSPGPRTRIEPDGR